MRCKERPARCFLQTCTPRPLLHALGAALFVLAPPILARLGHPALTAHWLLLGCFWVRSQGAQLTRRQAFLACAVLTFCSSAIHPYLALMVVVLVGAYYARFLSNHPGSWFADVLAPLTALAVLAAIVHWQSGYFVVPGSTLVAGGLGLGVFSLNLLNPLRPMGRSRLFDLPFTPPVNGQFEGYAYWAQERSPLARSRWAPWRCGGGGVARRQVGSIFRSWRSAAGSRSLRSVP